jgi:hypothetical protein
MTATEPTAQPNEPPPVPHVPPGAIPHPHPGRFRQRYGLRRPDNLIPIQPTEPPPPGSPAHGAAVEESAAPNITTASETVTAAPVADQVAPTAYPWIAPGVRAVGPSDGPGHPAWQQQAANTATKNNSGLPGAVFTLLGGILIIVGSFLSWMTVVGNMGAVDISGMAGGRDGVITLVLGVIVLGIGLVRLASRVYPFLQLVPVIICGAITLVIGAADLQNINAWVNSNPDTYHFIRSTGPGPYLVIVGAIVAIVGGLILSRRSQPDTLRVPFYHGATRILGCSQEDAVRLAAKMGVKLTDEYSLAFFVSLRDRLRQGN